MEMTAIMLRHMYRVSSNALTALQFFLLVNTRDKMIDDPFSWIFLLLDHFPPQCKL